MRKIDIQNAVIRSILKLTNIAAGKTLRVNANHEVEGYTPSIGGGDDITFEYRDVDGTDLVYILRLKSSYPFTINALSMVVDTGSFTGIAVKINGTAVTGLDNVTADATLDTTMATAANTVDVDDIVTIELTGTRTDATKLIGELHIIR